MSHGVYPHPNIRSVGVGLGWKAAKKKQNP